MPILTDWLMVGITGIYVLATILICIFNAKSAKATREQVTESKRQFEESKRLQIMPYLQLEFVDSDVNDAVPCAFIEMHNHKDGYTTTQAFFTLKNIGLGIAHHTKVTVTTRYKKDDGYPAFDIVMPPNCEKSTYVQFNVAKYKGELGRKEDIIIHIIYDDILGNMYEQEAQIIMIVREEGAELFNIVNMKSPQLISRSQKASIA